MLLYVIKHQVIDRNLKSSDRTTGCEEEILCRIELTKKHGHVASEQTAIFY